LLWFFCFHKT